jgi:hypothetical protein
MIASRVANHLDQPRQFSGQVRFLKRGFDQVRPHPNGVLLLPSRLVEPRLVINNQFRFDKPVFMRLGSRFYMRDAHAGATYRIVRRETMGVVIHCDASSYIHGRERSLCRDILLVWK